LGPLDVCAAFKAEKDIILLDSSMTCDLGRYSFLGLNPLKGRRGACFINGEGD
jgi:hypothetical protein